MSVLLSEVEEVLVPAPDPEEDRAAALLGLINRDRAALGRRELAPGDALLRWTAQYRAEVVAATGHYSHVSPTGETAAGILAALGGPARAYAGESLWACLHWQDCSPTGVHRVFTASEPHRQNQLRPEYTHAGFGFARNAADDLLVIELFNRQG